MTMAALPADSTLRGLRRSDKKPAVVWARRLTVLGMLGLVVVAGLGLLGVKSAQVSSAAAGYTLTVTYAATARAGLDVPFRVEVTRDEPFSDADITLRINARYFDIFETQGFHPEPAEEASAGEMIELTFDPPSEGKQFAVDYDAYIQPASQLGADGLVELVIGDEFITAVDFRTTLIP